MLAESKVVPEQEQKKQLDGGKNTARKPAERQAGKNAKSKTSSHQYKTKRKKEVSTIYVVGNATALVVIVTLVLISLSNSKPRQLPMVPEPTPASVETPVSTAPAEKVTDPVKVNGPSLPQGVITVPKVALRTGHSFGAKIMQVKVRKGERVSIIRRHSPAAGPQWLKVKTNKGTIGWVMASVVK
ncbi:MAG: SH3 domain-containing protein [Ignavibacteria bacterium]|nr:SH3 domain-containing protein [Ignavibacteria bacterium]